MLAEENMKKTCLTVLLSLFLSQLLAETITVTGKVVDENNDPIENVDVYTDNKGITTNENGLFELSVNKQDFITFSHIGYEKIKLSAEEISQIIYLSPISLRTEDVYVRSGLREISLLDATSSVTIIGKENLNNEPSNHFQGLTHSIPNLNWAGGTSRPRYFQIRGIGERSLYSGEGPPNFSVGFVIDDIDFTGIGMPGLLFDMNQIEVFRGPQSSIFGSNAMAGLISMRSAEAISHFESSIHTMIATDHTRHVGISVNTPVLSSLNTRFSVFSSETDGFRENQYQNVTNSNGKSELIIRNKSIWFPYSFIQFDLTALYSKQNNKYDAWTADNNEKLITYSDREGKDSQGSHAFSLRGKVQNVAGFDLLSITSYSQNELEHSYDGDWGNHDYWAGEPYNYYEDNQDYFSEEACIANESDYPCYYPYDFYDKTIRNRKMGTEEIRIYKYFSNQSSVIAGIYTKLLSEKDNASGYLFAGDASKYDGSFDINDIAGYIQYEQQILNDFRITLNTRFETSQIKYSGRSNYYGNNDTTIVCETKDELAGFRSALQYNMNANTMMYLSLSRGYKAGGINQNPNLSSINRKYEPEYNWNYEIGCKNFTKKGHSQLTLFYMNREDQQVNISSQQEEGNPSTFYFYTANATTGYNTGAEFEQSFNITDNFKIICNLGYLNTQVDPYVFKTNEITTVILGDREQAHAPKYTHSVGFSYDLPYGLILSMDVSGKDKFYFSDSHNLQSEPYQLTNMNVKYNRDNWSISAWGKNILDIRYAIRGFYFGLEPPNYEDKLYVHWGDPIQYGITLKYHF